MKRIFFSNEDVQNASCACFHPQLKLFHSELLAQLEQKLELDIKYLTVSRHVEGNVPYFWSQFRNLRKTFLFLLQFDLSDRK